MKKEILTLLLAMLLAPVGMEAKKKVNKEPVVPQLINYPSTEASEYRLHGGNVVVQGRIIIPEAKGEKMPQDEISKLNGIFSVIMRDYIVNKEKTLVIEFKTDGTFSMNVYVPYPMQILIYPMGTAYACPGDTINITIDPSKPTKEEGITFDGTGLGGEVTRLLQVIDAKYSKFDWTNNVHEKGPDSLMAWKDDQVAKMDELVRQMNEGLPELAGCSPLASDILRTHILADRLKYIIDYYMRAENNLRKDSTLNVDAYWQQFYSFVAPRAKYLTDNPLLMIAGDDMFFNRVEYHMFSPLNRGGLIEYIPFDYTLEDAEYLSKQKHVFRRESRRNAMNELQEKLHISPTDFSAQVCQLRNVFSMLKWHNDNYNKAADDVAAGMSVITHPDLIRQGILAFRQYVKDNEIKVAEQKLMTKGDSIFQRIIEPYKGNVLFVDFWEMSCGPCRGGMLQMRGEVEANKDKPVKYLYVTDDTPEHCKSFLEPNNIKGEHIFISRSEWGYLQQKFNFTGIPFAVFVDKQGKVRKNVTIEQLLNE